MQLPTLAKQLTFAESRLVRIPNIFVTYALLAEKHVHLSVYVATTTSLKRSGILN
jgi:hypothetical protein